MRTGSIGWHVLLEDMYCWRTCCRGGHAFHGNVLGEDMSSRCACLTGLCRSCNHLSCCEFRQLVFFFPPVIIFFALTHAFQGFIV